MDELEISGRRFISTKRAAKEHKYHSDYIGQLIRGGKVVGQKVGRSWYVDAESLEQYLNTEGSVVVAAPVAKVPVMKVAPVKKQEAVVVEEKVAEPEQEIEEAVADPEVVADAPQETEPIAIHVEKEIEPVVLHVQKEETKPETKSGGLRYVEEKTPFMPPLQKVPHALHVMPRAPQHEPIAQEESAVEQPRPTRKFARATSLVVAGGIALIIFAAVSTLLISTTNVVAGQPAAVHYGISADSTSF